MALFTIPDPNDAEANAEEMRAQVEAKRAAELEAEQEAMMMQLRRAGRKQEVVDDKPYIEDQDLAFLKGK